MRRYDVQTTTVRCPQCGAQRMKRNIYTHLQTGEQRESLVCLSCGYRRTLHEVEPGEEERQP